MTILLVDDDQDDQDIFREAVAMVVSDTTCLIAKDGVDAFTQLETLAALPDFIFLDVNMPRMDGKEFLKRVKSHPVYQPIPVVMYSTSCQKNEIGDFFRLGASNFITKPSELSLLITYLKSVLL